MRYLELDENRLAQTIAVFATRKLAMEVTPSMELVLYIFGYSKQPRARMMRELRSRSANCIIANGLTALG